MSELTDNLAGKFIVLDGPDGSGKSTQVAMLADWLAEKGLTVTQTRDPGGTEIGDKIRTILLDRKHTAMAIGCEILLYMASRTQLMSEVIGPALSRSECVLCDRWVSSTVAYQVADQTATVKEVMDIYDLALRKISPDLTVILDIPAERGLSRLVGDPDRMEAKGVAFHRKVRQLFLQQAKSSPSRFAIIDACGTAHEVNQQLQDCITNWGFVS